MKVNLEEQSTFSPFLTFSRFTPRLASCYGRLLFCILSLLIYANAQAADLFREVPEVLGIPTEFYLFAATLLGVALFHHRTLEVALTGLTVIVLYKLAFTGFRDGDGIPGLISHLGHEWVILTNLLGLLMGFALLSKHFEDSRIP